jgi:hypothetical protein
MPLHASVRIAKIFNLRSNDDMLAPTPPTHWAQFSTSVASENGLVRTRGGTRLDLGSRPRLGVPLSPSPPFPSSPNPSSRRPDWQRRTAIRTFLLRHP